MACLLALLPRHPGAAQLPTDAAFASLLSKTSLIGRTAEALAAMSYTASDGKVFGDSTFSRESTNNGSSSHSRPSSASMPSFPFSEPQFDILEWHPAYQSCQRYFVNHAQFNPGVQALAALMNITLPFQKSPAAPRSLQVQPVRFDPQAPYALWDRGEQRRPSQESFPPEHISLVPYLRRLVITGFDKEPVLHGFFGDDWNKGMGPLQECERRNYMFLAKAGDGQKSRNRTTYHPRKRCHS